MLSQWRRGMVARGLATATLLAVPVTVAAAIGFEGSLGGLYDGLDAVISGPETSQGEPAAAASDAEPTAATEPAAAAAAAPARDNAGGSGGGGGGQTGAGTDNGASSLDLPAGGDGGNAITSPGGGPGGIGGAVGDVLNGVNETVSGLLGGNNKRP